MQRHLFIILLLLLSRLSSFAQQLTDVQPQSTSTLSQSTISPVTPHNLTDSIINYGKLFLNRPYRYGSSGDSTFDCSGFTSFVYRKFGYQLKRSSAEQAEQFETVDTNQLKPGDLVYFSGHRRSRRVGHVGIVVSNNGNGKFDFIHASVQSGVVISHSEENYYANRFVKANRVIGGNQDFLRSLTQTPAIQNPKTPVQDRVEKQIPAQYHRVKKGETLSAIAEKYGLSIAQLKSRNNLSGSRINPGQELKVEDEKVVLVAVSSATIKPTNNDSSSMNNVDSKQNGKTHLVKKGESLFSISNKYHIAIDKLKEINKLNGNKLFIGQEIKLGETTMQETAPVEVASKSVAKETLHTVKSGETLFSIAKLYNVSIDDIKKSNELKGNNILPNQKLKVNASAEHTSSQTTKASAHKSRTHTVRSGESFYSIARDNNCSVNDLKQWNNKSTSKLNIGEKLEIH